VPRAVSWPAHAPEACRERRARLQNGTTYNSYLIFGGDKTALVDVSHEKFRGLYMPALRAQLERAGRGLDYVFVSHTEPDHSGAFLMERSEVVSETGHAL
jgi:flavorubredoxin